MSKRALKRVRREVGLPVNREPLPAYAWPGGYPIFYIFRDGGVCCPECTNANIVSIDEERNNSHGGWALAASEVNYEDDSLYCDHCGAEIESAYGDDEVKVKVKETSL
jgi:uncharacterized protein YbaR (Trm112 family)